MNYYDEIKNKLTQEEIYARVKDYSKERHKIETYYEVGKMLSEAGKHYGEGIIKEYSKKLTQEIGKGYTQSRLRYFRRFYIVFSKCPTWSDKLTFSHYCEIIWFEESKMLYYMNMAKNRKLSVRELREIIKSKEYERLPERTKKKLINNEETSLVTDYIKDPIVIKSNLKNEINERILQRLILEDIESFLKELGDGFTFVGSEYKIKIGETYNYIDILLFNYIYNAFIVVELKVVPLKKEHIGQIEVYMNYVDKHIKSNNHDKTIGLIITRRNNKFILEYASDKRILAKEYKLI